MHLYQYVYVSECILLDSVGSPSYENLRPRFFCWRLLGTGATEAVPAMATEGDAPCVAAAPTADAAAAEEGLLHCAPGATLGCGGVYAAECSAWPSSLRPAPPMGGLPSKSKQPWMDGMPWPLSMYVSVSILEAGFACRLKLARPCITLCTSSWPNASGELLFRPESLFYDHRKCI